MPRGAAAAVGPGPRSAPSGARGCRRSDRACRLAGASDCGVLSKPVRWRSVPRHDLAARHPARRDVAGCIPAAASSMPKASSTATAARATSSSSRWSRVPAKPAGSTRRSISSSSRMRAAADLKGVEPRRIKTLGFLVVGLVGGGNEAGQRAVTCVVAGDCEQRGGACGAEAARPPARQS